MTSPSPRPESLDTIAVWGGEEASLCHGATQVPVVHSVAVRLSRPR